MNKLKTKAFTLVELIVVITILAILGTIAFISLQGYSTSSRDSVRISDISTIKSSLELFNLEAGKYPIPTSGIDITYSGAVVWNQGTFGKTVYANVLKLDKIPLDPTTDKEYTYSVNSNRYEYQLGGIVEGDVVAMNSIVLQTNAGETTATAYITGNYNGLMIKSLSGTTCNVLSIPAIITNDTSITDLQQIVTNSSFVYRGYKNLPASFKTSKFKYNGGFAFTPNNLIAYTDTGSCTALTSSTVSTARVNLLKGLQDAYSGTTLKNEGEIKNIVGLSINTSSPSNEVINYAGNFVNNVLGGKLIFSDSNVSGNESNFSASGGIVTDIPGYRVHTFLTGGIFSVNGTKNVEVLVVAGGGAGGNYADGGGGAGGVLTGTTVVTTNAYNVTIGLGGVGTRGYGVWNAWGNPSAGTNGGDSSFSTFVSIGGGRSGYNTTNGASGGSGGGGGYYAPTPGNGTPGQGYAGGIGSGNLGCSSIGGGGGGAGGVGQNYSSAGIGGIGITSNIDGTSKVYATGGNAVMNCNAVTDGVDGTPNTGKGGGSAGGGSTGGYFGGDGGSGIVIIRYVYP